MVVSGVPYGTQGEFIRSDIAAGRITAKRERRARSCVMFKSWRRPSKRIEPFSGRWTGFARSFCSGVRSARSRTRGSNCVARRSGSFQTRLNFTRSFTRAASVGSGSSFASKEAIHDEDAGTQRGGSFSIGEVTLAGTLGRPERALGIVLFAHGSGSSRHSSRNRFVAATLRKAGLGTPLFALLTRDDEAEDLVTGRMRFAGISFL